MVLKDGPFDGRGARPAEPVKAPPLPSTDQLIREAFEQGAALGWRACRKQVFALCVDAEQTFGDVDHAFARGRVKEAKATAQRLGDMEPEHCAILRKDIEAFLHEEGR